jgi:hypothetical protein
MILLLPLLASLLGGAGETASPVDGLQPAVYGPVRISGFLADSRIAESSGLAASNQVGGRFWTHNDGGNDPLIFAIDAGGNKHGFVRLESARNQDWEDLTAFQLDGQNYLGIADVGDNGGIRKSIRIYIIKEPDSPQGQSVRPERVLEFILDDGPRDIESVAFDATDRAFYLLSKRGYPAYLYRLPWPDDDSPEIQTAIRVGVVDGIPQPDASDKNNDPKGWRYRAQPTAMDISRDGRLAIVLTYRHAYLFPRQLHEPWGTAMARAPQLIRLPALPQGEGIAFGHDGQILVSTEKWPAALLLIQTPQ